jgi:hypothetical protein
MGCCLGTKAQQPASGTTAAATDTTAPTRITSVLTDSLGLNAIQSDQIRRINLWADSAKRATFRQWAHTPTLNSMVPKVEYSRDSAIQQLLTDKQYVQYGQHKLGWVLNQ